MILFYNCITTTDFQKGNLFGVPGMGQSSDKRKFQRSHRYADRQRNGSRCGRTDDDQRSRGNNQVHDPCLLDKVRNITIE